MEKEILTRGYITHALTNQDGTIFGLNKDCYISVWDNEGKYFYWSDVYCEHTPHHTMARIIRKGRLLVNPTNQRLNKYHEQSKINLSE